jgi:O-antigen ligase
LLVAALFLQRFEQFTGTGYPLIPRVPDVLFFSAFAVFAAKALLDLRTTLVRQSVGVREAVIAGFVVVVAAISTLAVATLPPTDANAHQVVKTVLHLAGLAIAAIVIGRALSPKLVRVLLVAYLTLATGAGALGLLQSLDLNALHSGLSNRLGLLWRLAPTGHYEVGQSIFSEPANLGYASLAGVAIAFAFAIERRSRLVLVALAICLLSLLATLSAGALAAAPVVIAYLLVAYRRQIGPRLLAVSAVLAGVAILGAAVTPVGDAAWTRFSALWAGQDASALYRQSVNRATIRIWEHAPVTGVGLGDSRYMLPRVYRSPFAKTRAEQRRTRAMVFPDSSAYLTLLAETGPLGVALFVVLLAVLLWPVRHADILSRRVTEAIFVMLAFQGLVINHFLLPPLWFWAGVRLALVRQAMARPR